MACRVTLTQARVVESESESMSPLQGASHTDFLISWSSSRRRRWNFWEARRRRVSQSSVVSGGGVLEGASRFVLSSQRGASWTDFLKSWSRSRRRRWNFWEVRQRRASQSSVASGGGVLGGASRFVFGGALVHGHGVRVGGDVTSKRRLLDRFSEELELEQEAKLKFLRGWGALEALKNDYVMDRLNF